MHTAVFEPGADQPSPLISEFNAIMAVGAASVSPWLPPRCSHCSFSSFEGEENPPDTNISPLAFHFHNVAYFLSCQLSPALLLQLVIYCREGA